MFRVCFNFLHTYDSANFKSIGNNTMKNATRYCAGPAYYRMCSTDVYCSKQTAAVAPKETITHHFFVSGIGQKKTVDAAKICIAAGPKLLNRNPANILSKWIARFYYFRHLYSAEARVYCHNCMSCPSIRATLSALLINILLGSFQLFLYSASSSLRVK